MTHLVAFQNQCEDVVVKKNLISIKRKTSRKLFIEDLNIRTIPNDRKKSHLQHLRQNKVQQMNLAVEARFFCGCILEKPTLFPFNQSILTFKGFQLSCR